MFLTLRCYCVVNINYKLIYSSYSSYKTQPATNIAHKCIKVETYIIANAIQNSVNNNLF